MPELSPETAGYRLEELVLFLKNDLHVRTVVLCQVINISHLQTPDFAFNKKAAVLRQYLSVVLDKIPGIFLWEHRAFNKVGHTLLSCDGVHCNQQRQFV